MRPFATALLATLAILAALLGPRGATGSEAQQAPSPCSTPEHRQFDFWVGDWVVSRPDGAAAGINRIEKILGGCALHERWVGADGSRGESFSMYFARERRWHQTWVDNAGGRLDLAGALQQGRMVLSGEMPGREGGRVSHRITWEPLDGGRVRQHWQASRDGGASWADVFIGVYEPRGEDFPGDD